MLTLKDRVPTLAAVIVEGKPKRGRTEQVTTIYPGPAWIHAVRGRGIYFSAHNKAFTAS